MKLDEVTSVSLGPMLGQGSFGLVRRGELTPGNIPVAVKLESTSKHRKYLPLEAQILHDLRQLPGVPTAYGFTITESHNVLVMDLLGESLNEKFKKCNRSFSPVTTLRLFDAILSVLEGVHGRRYVHRDIKPHNFLTGTDSQGVYIIDFGLSRKMLDSPPASRHARKGIVGTLPFVSLNMHLSLPASCRDDLEAVGFMLIYLAKGSLPWYDPRKKKLPESEIRELKQETHFPELCAGLPTEILSYLTFVRALPWDAVLDYNSLRGPFQTAVDAIAFQTEHVFDWVKAELQDSDMQKRLTVECLNPFSRLHSNQFTPNASASHSVNEHLSVVVKEPENVRASFSGMDMMVRKASGTDQKVASYFRKSSDPSGMKKHKVKKHKQKHEVPKDVGLSDTILNLDCFSTPIVHASKNKLAGTKLSTRKPQSCALF